MELWAGAECTVNRVGDTFGDQLLATGHHDRLSDIDLVAQSGFQAIRFPVLWERVSPDRPDKADWSWSDTRLERLRQLQVRPILGLIHHGSGPRYTSLLDDGFAPGLARHALETARRYPWVTDWTPVNEPLTTARFSALYGHWYPHARDEGEFWTALLNQIDGVRLSMSAIRTVNPGARLIQTDDLGRTYATRALVDQAAFDNARRWMGWDLLCGRVDHAHELWTRLCSFGLEERLRSIADDPCPPDMIGINHYLTSDRFLDHRVQRYPRHAHGSNGRQMYADVEAVRVLKPSAAGVAGAIGEAWARYGIPIAITEVHNGCTREEQLRWFKQTWDSALAARAQGVDVRAVTMWALFGSRGWNTLLTGDGVYEPGAYDVSGGVVRPTALAKFAQTLGLANDAPPAACGPGWWERDIRLVHPEVSRPAPLRQHTRDPAPRWDERKPILILGASGTLCRALAAACRHRGIDHVLTSRRELDLHDAGSIAGALARHRPWAVINAAGWVRVDDAELEPDGCIRANAHGAVDLARACNDRDIPLLNFSSDLVFDGSKGAAYFEDDATAPLNVYGRSKAEMEGGVLALGAGQLVVRTAAFFSPFDEWNFAMHVCRALARGERFAAADDSEITPTYVPDLCRASLDLLIDGEDGIWHLTNEETLSWASFATRIAEANKLDGSLIDPVPGRQLGWRAIRPNSCGLQSRRGSVMPSLDHAIEHFRQHRTLALA